MNDDPLEPNLGWFKMRWAVYIQLLLVAVLIGIYVFKYLGWFQ